jgi:hypothetical protein
MAIYKVPQDVEADDKLIGPFSFRQFVYLIIVTLSGVIAWFLGGLFIPLAIIPLPIILFFGALALPLRKDQPMEIYMAAMAMYFLKPRRRLWSPDCIDTLIEITVPKTQEFDRTKGITQNEAERRFNYLAEIVDSKGWAVRGSGVQQAGSSALNSDVYFAAQQVNDILDSDNLTAKSFDDKLTQSDARNHQQLVNKMSSQFGVNIPAEIKAPVFNPYPAEIVQKVINPVSTLPPRPQSQPQKPIPERPATSSVKPTPAAIINLANNPDLSIATIAHEANRISENNDQEVVISLR